MSQIITKFIKNAAVNLTTKVTGLLPIANGGTGASTQSAGFDALSPMTAAGDLIYGGTAGTGTRLAAGTNGHYLKLDTGLPVWAAVSGATSALAVRSVTTTDTCTNADDLLLLSGASFTQTLFTAVGNTGKVITLQHSGTNLTQNYTLATTSGQTIGGYASGAYILCTNGETLKLVSDGANWLILEHKTETDWVSAGNFIDYYVFTITSGNCTLAATYTNNGNTYVVARTAAAQTTVYLTGTADPLASGTLTKASGTGDATLTFSAFTGKAYRVTATTTAPTYNATTTRNSYHWKRSGDNGRFVRIRVNFYATVAGVVGSGDYIWPMPENISIDSAIFPFFTGGTAQAIIAQDEANIGSLYPAAWGRQTSNGAEQWSAQSSAPYDATHYRIYGTFNNTDGCISIGSGYIAANSVSSFVWELEFPVLNWKP